MNLQVTDAMFALLRTVFGEKERLSVDETEIIKNNLLEMYEISKRNDMAHLIGYALEKQGLVSPEDEVFSKFQKQQYLAIFRCEGMEYEIARMRESLEKNGIDHVLLKGSVIRGLYPEGWMRTSSDIDVLVRHSDFDSAVELLVGELGYKKGIEGTHDTSLHSEGGVHIELHFDLLEDDRSNNAKNVLKDVWNHSNTKSGTKHEYELSCGMFYFYHIAHLAKHVEHAGSGIRPFLDLWLINKSGIGNLHAAQNLLEQCGMDRFAGLCDELSSYWFDGKNTNSLTVKKLERFVLNCGIYGSEENRIKISRKKGGGTFGYIFRRLFIPYSLLKQSYPILVKHKWLTPFCQIARWFKLVTGEKTRKAIHEVKTSSSTSKKEVDEMQDFFDEIGLNKK